MHAGYYLLAELPPRFWGFLGFSSFVLITALAMLALHIQSWRKCRTLKLPREDYDFAWRRYVRRTQTSGMLVSLAVFLFAGQFIMAPLVALFYWAGVLLMIVWVIALAMLDLVSSRRHFARIAHSNRLEQARLKAKLQSLEQDPPSSTGRG